MNWRSARGGRRARGATAGARDEAACEGLVRLSTLRILREVEADGEGLVHHRISNEEEPCNPNGTTFHSNWPSCDRKLVFHRSEARTWSW